MALRNWQGDARMRDYRNTLERRMNVITQKLAAATAKNLGRSGGARSGRFYRRPGGGISYQASAPGQFPAFVTGTLQRGVRGHVETGRGKITGFVAVRGVKYAKFLEFGTSRMAARPFLRPTIHENRGAIMAVLQGRGIFNI